MSWTAMQGESRPMKIRMVTSGWTRERLHGSEKDAKMARSQFSVEDQRSPCTCARSSADTHVAFPKDLQNQAKVGQEVEAEPTCSPVVQVED